MTAALDSWRAAVIWAHSAGTFSRRFAWFGRLMWPLSATFHLIAAAAHADQLRVHEGAAIILGRERGRPRVGALMVALAYTLAVWTAVTVGAHRAVDYVGPVGLLILPFLAMVVGADVIGTALVPMLSPQARRTFEDIRAAGAVPLASLAAWPRRRGHGDVLMHRVAAELDAHSASAVLTCRRDLRHWYRTHGFVDQGPVMVRPAHRTGQASAATAAATAADTPG